ncbi:hypothetical protein R2359_19095 [Mycobacteroides chelonae]|nr:hypothetical protein [Mycobacteroides chelonae]MEC4846151.1 hypothetical protein [Mycobacteroides chelonae]MEC4846177.1 hypothetical protein [Mycobacteroides chelonae]
MPARERLRRRAHDGLACPPHPLQTAAMRRLPCHIPLPALRGRCAMSAAGKIPKLANPKSPAVLAALRIQCPTCKAAPQQRCRGLNYRIVHFARCTFKEIP